MNTEMDLADTTTTEIEFASQKQTVKANAQKWLHLLLTLGLCRRTTQPRSLSLYELTLPPGCVRVARCSSHSQPSVDFSGRRSVSGAHPE